MMNPNLRNYRIPTYADIPRTEVIIVESHDSVGPMASKGIAESNVNPVAPALANALQDATGVRYRELPLTPERIYARLDSIKLIAGNLEHGHQEAGRHRRHGHHRRASPSRLRAGIHCLAARIERSRLALPRIHRGGGHPTYRRPTRLGRGLPLRFHREPPGVDEQCHEAGRTRRSASISSTDRPPSRWSAAAAKPADQLVTVVVTHRVESGGSR